MFKLFNRRNAAEDARRQLQIEVLRAQVGESVERRRNGTTDVRSLMDQLQAGDQGDSRLQRLRAARALNTRRADDVMAGWASESIEALQARARRS